MNKITSKITQVDESNYFVKNDLGTTFKINIDTQTCQCGKTNCKHIQELNSKIYRKRKVN